MESITLLLLFSKLPKIFYTFYSTFITLFHQTPHSQYKTKVFFTYYQDIRSR